MKSKILRKRYKLIKGNKRKLPIVYVLKTNKFIYCQCATKGKTIACESDVKMKTEGSKPLTKSQRAQIVGKAFGEKLKQLKIAECVYDFRGARFFGRIKALVENINQVIRVKADDATTTR